jgi:transposase
VIQPLLPQKPRGVPRVDDRRVLNGIFWVLRSGAPWRDLPDRYGPRTTCYNRFVRWRRSGVLDRQMDATRVACDGNAIRDLIESQGAVPNIPAKSNRKWKPRFSKTIYRERNQVERFFSKLKHLRRVATRYDKLADNFLAMVKLASMRLWPRAYESTV